MKKSVFLCGFMGCGKSSCGKALSEKLKVGFIDTDEVIEATKNISVSEIFRIHGEEYFRELEKITVSLLCGIVKFGVISLGGGTLTVPNNAETIKSHGLLVFIDTDFTVCYERIKNDSTRPLAAETPRNNLESLYNKRKEVYTSHADFVVNGNSDIDTVVRSIITIHDNL
ncbi:MAG: shikimate kinase [Oscillospiraceae bacterium]|nr:shikimate kinase [Oscillospiraceae bacterium]